MKFPSVRKLSDTGGGKRDEKSGKIKFAARSLFLDFLGGSTRRDVCQEFVKEERIKFERLKWIKIRNEKETDIFINIKRG